MTTVERVLALRAIDFFRELPGEDLAQVASIAEEDHHEAGEALLLAGDRGDGLVLLVDGRVRVERSGETSELSARTHFDELSLLEPLPREATVTAIGEVFLLRIGREEFLDLLVERPALSRGVVRELVRRLRARR